MMNAKNRATTLVTLGEAALKAGGTAQAAAYFRSALELSPGLTQAMNGLGIVEAQAGNLARAIELFELVKAKQPRNHGAISNLGNLYKLMGRIEDAIGAHMEALRINPRDSNAYNNLGAALLQTSQFEAAEKALRTAIKLEARNQQAHYNLGTCLGRQGLHTEAKAEFELSAKLGSHFPELFYEWGVAAYALGEYVDAANAFDKAVVLRPNYPQALNGKGRSLDKLGHLDQALATLRQAVLLAPDFPEALDNLGVVLQRQGNLESGLRCHQEALRYRPDFTDALNNCGAALQGLQRYSEAQACYERALALGSRSPGLLNNLAGVHKEARRYKEALALYESAIALSPEETFIYNCSLVHLHLGQYEKGWPLYESRWGSDVFRGNKVLSHTSEKGARLTTPKPVWSPEIEARRILVWAEQGLGDELLYGSMLSLIIKRFESVTALVDPRLVGLLSRSGQSISFRSRLEIPPPDAYDAHLAMGSLGRYSVTSESNLPHRQMPYAVADPVRVKQMAHWRGTIKRKRLVALSWRSSNPRIGSAKTLKLEMLLPLLKTPDTAFVSVQYGNADTEIDNFLAQHDIEVLRAPGLDLFNDIEGLASLLANCDLLISSSNSNVHLAGAMGLPVWLFAPLGMGFLWYWSARTGRMSHWYPSVEIFDQVHDPDWSASIAEMAGRLNILPQAGTRL
jgi:tetratricopeptide (TPR) repeat protein